MDTWLEKGTKKMHGNSALSKVYGFCMAKYKVIDFIKDWHSNKIIVSQSLYEGLLRPLV